MILSWWEMVEKRSVVGPDEKKLAYTLMEYLGIAPVRIRTGGGGAGSQVSSTAAGGPSSAGKACEDYAVARTSTPKGRIPTYMRVREIKDGYIKERNEAEPGSLSVQAMQKYDAVADAVERLLEVLSEE